jgi:hypothetical protein
MATPESFADLLARLRAADEGAVRDFVAAYEPSIRRTLRLQLAAPVRR